MKQKGDFFFQGHCRSEDWWEAEEPASEHREDAEGQDVSTATASVRSCRSVHVAPSGRHPLQVQSPRQEHPNGQSDSTGPPTLAAKRWEKNVPGLLSFCSL